MKPPILQTHHYLVNIENNEISMMNFKNSEVDLIVYDKNAFNTKNYYFSYKLHSNDKLTHPISFGTYSYEIIGINGFVRKFKGKKKPEIEVILSNTSSKDEIKIELHNIPDENFTISLENLYEKTKKEIKSASSKYDTVINLEKTKGWYDIKIKTENNSWHFAGRTEH